MKYDLIIIGGGPAGLTAALYAARRSLKTLVIAQAIGGQCVYAPEVENYPGFDIISGGELSSKFFTQAQKYGAEFKFEQVSKLSKIDDSFSVETNMTKYDSDSVILAFGKTPRDLNVKGEQEFKGKGVSYCATCDALFFREKVVAVAGGGNSAAESAVLLAKTSKKIYLIHRRSEFTAEKVLLDEIHHNPKIELIVDTVIEEVKGDQKVSSIMLKNTKNETASELALDGIFVEIGFVVNAEFTKDLVELDQRNQIIIDQKNQTKTEGLFAAGDVTQVPYKQIVIAAGEGAKAALVAYDYLMSKQGKSGVYSGKY